MVNYCCCSAYPLRVALHMNYYCYCSACRLALGPQAVDLRATAFASSACSSVQVLHREVLWRCCVRRPANHAEKSDFGKVSLHWTHFHMPRTRLMHLSRKHLRSSSPSVHIHDVNEDCGSL